MKLEDAYRILDLSPGSTFQEIRKAYRKMALNCHPDRCKDPDASIRFIEIASAYETIIEFMNESGTDTISQSERSDIEEELSDRLTTISKAFFLIKNDFVLNLKATESTLCEDLINLLYKYKWSLTIKMMVPDEYPKIVINRFKENIKDINSKVQKISADYQEWMNGFMRETYKYLSNDALKKFLLKKIFWKNILTFGIIFVLLLFVFMSFLESILNKYNYSMQDYLVYDLIIAISTCLVLTFVSGYKLYKRQIIKKYQFKDAIIGLDTNRFLIKQENLTINYDKGWSRESAVGIGAVVGGIGGFMIGGPFAAAFGGWIGGIIGSDFGENPDQVRKKIAEKISVQLQSLLVNYEEMIRAEINKIEILLIDMIKDNYSKNKKKAMKLLAASTAYRKTKANSRQI